MFKINFGHVWGTYTWQLCTPCDPFVESLFDDDLVFIRGPQVFDDPIGGLMYI